MLKLPHLHIFGNVKNAWIQFMISVKNITF